MLTLPMLCVRDNHVDVQQDQHHHRQAEPQASHGQPLLQFHDSLSLSDWCQVMSADTPGLSCWSQTHHWRLLEVLEKCYTHCDTLL